MTERTTHSSVVSAKPPRLRDPRPWSSFSEAYKTRRRDKLKQKRRDNIRVVSELKAARTCCKCGFPHPAALHFHHLDNKTIDVNQLLRRTTNMSRIMAEISKCVVMCANCHALEHLGDERALS